MKFVLTLPPTFNKTYKTGTYSGWKVKDGRVYSVTKSRMYKAKEVSDWEMEAFVLIKQQMPKMIEGYATVVLKWCLKHDRDIDSGEKVVLDVLQKARVISNDSNFFTKHSEKYTDKKNPRVEVYVIPSEKPNYKFSTNEENIQG